MAFFRVPNQSYRWLFAEMTVVVLGILIAFQIEEWRQDSVERGVANANLEAILFELEDELFDINDIINDSSAAPRAAAELANFIINDESRDEEWIIQTYAEAISISQFRPSSPT